MAVVAEEWLDLIDREYLRGFIADGGGVVKFVEGEAERLADIQEGLSALARQSGFAFCRIDASRTRIHMIQDVFFAISRSLDWAALARTFLEGMVERNGYRWPKPGAAATFAEVAAANGIEERLFRLELNRWMTEEIMRDRSISQDFRVAVSQLCLAGLEPADSYVEGAAPVLEWLRGELRAIGALRQIFITSRITRHNARAMLRSLCRWLRLCGGNGLCLALDIRQVLHIAAADGDLLRYSAAAVIDAFEALRQLIDDSEAFEALLVVVLADDALTSDDPKRSLNAYAALRMRVSDDVRATGRDNPLAALVRLGPRHFSGEATL